MILTYGTDEFRTYYCTYKWACQYSTYGIHANTAQESSLSTLFADRFGVRVSEDLPRPAICVKPSKWSSWELWWLAALFKSGLDQVDWYLMNSFEVPFHFSTDRDRQEVPTDKAAFVARTLISSTTCESFPSISVISCSLSASLHEHPCQPNQFLLDQGFPQLFQCACPYVIYRRACTTVAIISSVFPFVHLYLSQVFLHVEAEVFECSRLASLVIYNFLDFSMGVLAFGKHRPQSSQRLYCVRYCSEGIQPMSSPSRDKAQWFGFSSAETRDDFHLIVVQTVHLSI
jgi:hypothetical protein